MWVTLYNMGDTLDGGARWGLPSPLRIEGRVRYAPPEDEICIVRQTQYPTAALSVKGAEVALGSGCRSTKDAALLTDRPSEPHIDDWRRGIGRRQHRRERGLPR